MRLTFVTDAGQTYTVEVSADMEIENIHALIEAESGIPAAEQGITYHGRTLDDPTRTLAAEGVSGDSMLGLRRRVRVAGREAMHDGEMMRLQLLGDQRLMEQLRQTQPDLADAAQNNPERFYELMRTVATRQRDAELNRQREIQALNDDPFNIEAQRKIEEAIRQEAVLESFEHAMEHSPETFGRVTMLYIDTEVNKHPVKAFVDSGAQSTIMSPDCAEACGIMRLLDTRFAGIARGVGTAKILGRVHSAQIKLGDLYLQCAFTIMEGKGVDLLFGLDMLKRHQACIDLAQNALIIQGRKISFLAEHQLPASARWEEQSAELDDPSSSSSASASASAAAGPSTAPIPPNPTGTPAPFPGAGQTLGAPGGGAAAAAGAGAGRFKEEDIQKIMEMGVSRKEAETALEAAGGNLEVAASMLW